MGVLGVSAHYAAFVGRSLFTRWDLRRTLPRLADQVWTHGVGALPVVLLAAVFVGLTTAIQTSYQLMGVVPKYFVGMGVGRLVLIELAPVFTGFVVAGRSASAMAAEIGAMRMSEQIDALEVMGVNPYRFLCLPRIGALVLSMPVLVVVMELAAVLVAMLISSVALNVSSYTFMYGVTHFFMARDFLGGLGKAVLFGLVVGVNGCFCGYTVRGGSRGVGRAATSAVVSSAAMILVLNFLVALFFFSR
ncbi:ABC transporter permease [candidate division WOR-3 bacterium]|nr:ABC transporter permease [candidate division WOR-3 bacterium]